MHIIKLVWLLRLQLYIHIHKRLHSKDQSYQNIISLFFLLYLLEVVSTIECLESSGSINWYFQSWCLTRSIENLKPEILFFKDCTPVLRSWLWNLSFLKTKHHHCIASCEEAFLPHSYDKRSHPKIEYINMKKIFILIEVLSATCKIFLLWELASFALYYLSWERCYSKEVSF